MERKLRVLLWITLVLCALGSVSAITKNKTHHGVNATRKYSPRWRPILHSTDALGRRNYSSDHVEETAKEQNKIRPGKHLADPPILDTHRVSEKLGDEGPTSSTLKWTEKVTRENYPQGYKSSFETRIDIAKRGKIAHLLQSIKSSQIILNVGGKRVAPNRREIQESQKNGRRFVKYFEKKAWQKREARTDARVDDRIYLRGTYTEASVNQSVNNERMSESLTGDLEARDAMVPGDYSKEESKASCDNCSSESNTDSTPFQVEEDEGGKEKNVGTSLEEEPILGVGSDIKEEYAGTVEESTEIASYFLLRVPIRCSQKAQSMGGCRAKSK